MLQRGTHSRTQPWSRRDLRGGSGTLFLLAVASLLIVAPVGSGCAPAAASEAAAKTEEQRLLPAIIRRQETQVKQARQAAAITHDEAASLRLSQRVLEEYGRPDLAAALDGEALKKEVELKTQQKRLADEEVALVAYRDYATRLGLAVESAPDDTRGRIQRRPP